MSGPISWPCGICSTTPGNFLSMFISVFASSLEIAGDAIGTAADVGADEEAAVDDGVVLTVGGPVGAVLAGACLGIAALAVRSNRCSSDLSLDSGAWTDWLSQLSEVPG